MLLSLNMSKTSVKALKSPAVLMRAPNYTHSGKHGSFPPRSYLVSRREGMGVGGWFFPVTQGLDKSIRKAPSTVIVFKQPQKGPPPGLLSFPASSDFADH